MKHHWHHSGVFVVNFEHISHFVLMFLLLTLTRQLQIGICSLNKLSSEINFIKKLAFWNGFPRPVVKSVIHEVLNTTDEATDNAKSSESSIFVCMPYYSKNFCYSSFVFAKFNLITSKLVALDARLNMMLKKFGFNATPKIKQLFCVICLLFMIFLSSSCCQLHWQNRKNVL